jgi:hypothetical protein
MPVDRSQWGGKGFPTSAWPSWTCPTCRSGVLQIAHDSVVDVETARSKKAQRDRSEDWEPSWYEGRFVARLVCGAVSCRDTVVVAGDVRVEEIEGYHEDTGEPGYEILRLFRPRLIHPQPDVFLLPANTPEEIASEIRRAFGLIWSDPSAAVNSLRTGVDRLMDHLRLPRNRRTSSGKLVRLTLHERIEGFTRLNAELGSALLAVKWIGNVGSHRSDLQEADVFDGLDIISHVLDEAIGQRSKYIERLTREINRAKGPRSRKRKRQP